MVTQVRALMATRNKCCALNIRSRAPLNMSPTCHLFDHFVMKIFFIFLNNTLGLHIIVTETNPQLNRGNKWCFYNQHNRVVPIDDSIVYRR